MDNPFRGKTVSLEELWIIFQAYHQIYPIIRDTLGVEAVMQTIKNPPPADQAEDGEKEP